MTWAPRGLYALNACVFNAVHSLVTLQNGMPHILVETSGNAKPSQQSSSYVWHSSIYTVQYKRQTPSGVLVVG